MVCGGDQWQRRSFERRKWIAIGIAPPEFLPFVLHPSPEAPVLGQPQAEGQACRFRQFAHQPFAQQPGVGLQAGDPRLARVKDQAQRVLVVEQRDSVVAQDIGEFFSFLQTLQELSASLTALPVLKGFFAGGQQQRTGARRLQQSQTAFDTHRIQTLPLQPEHCRLRQGCS